MTDKEKLLACLKEWAAAGFKLRRDATHIYPGGEPVPSYMKKVEGRRISRWAEWKNDWKDQLCVANRRRYLPLSLLSDEELKEFIEDSTGEGND